MWMSQLRWEARTLTPMAEVVETRDLTEPSQNGWTLADEGNLRRRVSYERTP
jgi:hypothetical protein